MKKLSTKITDLKSLYQGTNIMTPYGVMLTKGCLDRYGAEGLNKTLQSGLEKGLSCLNSLAKNYYAQKTLPIPLVSHNLSKISEIMQQKTNPVKLICDNNQDPDRWKRAAAFASTGPTSEKILNQYAHPYICLSPLYRDKSQGPLKNKEEEFIDTLELQKTVFHELLHTLGYRHYQDIEFSYTCEECCFGDQIDYDSPNCRICTGGYDGVNDEKYFDDLMLLENVTSSSDTSSTRYLFNHISKSSNSRYLTFSLFNLSKKYASFHQALFYFEIYDRKFSVKSPYEIHQLDLIKQRKLPAASEDQKN
jgi:hypothetical protein